jgi:hypothetical protein
LVHIDPTSGTTRSLPFYTSSTANPSQITQDAHGRLWVAAVNLHVLEPGDGRLHDVSDTDGAQAVAIDGDSVWVVTSSELVQMSVQPPA